MTVRQPGETGALPAVHEAWLPREHSLHRPRHGRRQLTALVCALVFFTAPTAMWLFGARPSAIENRALAGFPGISQGWGAFTGLDEWGTDQLVFRSAAIEAADNISRTLFGEPAPFDQGGSAPGGPLPGSPAEVPVPPGLEDGDQPGATDAAGFRRVVLGSDNWMYYGYDSEAKCKPKEPIDTTIAQLNRLRAAVESSGRKFMLVAAPDKTTAAPEHLPATYPGKDCATAAGAELWGKLTTLAGAIDLRGPLHQASVLLRRPVYFAQDSHWTPEGALTMVRQVADRVQPGVSGAWVIRPTQPFDAPSDLPPLIGRSGRNTGVSYQLLPDGVTIRPTPTSFDLSKPVRLTAPPTPGTVGQPTIVLGDSFAAGAAPYLPGAFNDITMVNYASAAKDPQTLINAVAANRVVVVEIIERNLAAGNPILLDQNFIDSLGPALARRPVR